MSMKNNILPVESIQERDIDLILLEEFNVDKGFCSWFIDKLKLPLFEKTNIAWRSISDFGLGETDILFSYISKGEIIYVLIENKLDASFQENQYDRYFQRANKYVETKKCHKVFCVLIAPISYCENQEDFKTFLSYEEISDKLRDSKSDRNIFKSTLLNIAIEKLRRGYKPLNAPIVQEFWNLYWEYKEKTYPSLEMKKPGIVPANSDWPMLYDERLGKNIVFYHKLAQGNIDVTFIGFSNSFETRIKEVIPDWTTFKKFSKTFAIRISTDKVDRKSSFNNQIYKIDNGLKSIEKIRDWIIENKMLES
tara:strand:+ start:9 stop:932 length:924 start_codon:yes stop_codon:yes gene_type:complete